MNTQKRLL